MSTQNQILNAYEASQLAADALRQFLDARPGEAMPPTNGIARILCAAQIPPPEKKVAQPTVIDLMQGLAKGLAEAHDNFSTLQNTIGPVAFPPNEGGCGMESTTPSEIHLSPAGAELLNLIKGMSELNRRIRATIQNVNL